MTELTELNFRILKAKFVLPYFACKIRTKYGSSVLVGSPAYITVEYNTLYNIILNERKKPKLCWNYEHTKAMRYRVHVRGRANNCTEYKWSSQYMKYYGLSAANERQTGRHRGYTDRQMVLRATVTFQPKTRVKIVHLNIMDLDEVTILLLLSMYSWLSLDISRHGPWTLTRWIFKGRQDITKIFSATIHTYMI